MAHTLNALNPEHTLVELQHDLYLLRKQKIDFINNIPDLTQCTPQQVADYQSFRIQEQAIIDEINQLFSK